MSVEDVKEPQEIHNDEVSRRTFLSTVTVAIGALITAGMGIPAVAYIIGPALKRAEDHYHQDHSLQALPHRDMPPGRSVALSLE